MAHSISATRNCYRAGHGIPVAGTRPASVNTRRSVGLRQFQALAIAVLLTATAAVVAASALASPAQPEPGAWTVVSVGPDCTLWQLALQNPIEGLDTASTVERIQTRNNMPSATLLVGQSVLVPAADTPTTAVASR